MIQQGGKRWGEIANQLNSEFHRGFRIRSGKQAKERWNNHLNPEINKGPWTLQEDLILLESHKKLKNRWSLIAKELENRTESSIKNRVKSLLNNSMLDLEFSIDPDKALDKLILRLKIEISGYVNAEESASPPSGHERTPNSNHNKKVNFSIASELTSEMAYK